MAPTVYSTDTLIGVVQNLIRPVSSLLDRYFPTITLFDTEEVHVDVIPGKRRIAPLVSPYVEGQIVESQGRRVNTLKPAYVKPKMRFQPQRAFKRAVGERIGGSLSPQQRFDLAIAQDLEDLYGMVTRRKELMASEAIRLGTVTLVGEKYPTEVVNFSRAAGNTIANNSGATGWKASTGKPLRDLKDWSLVGLQASGVGLVDVVLGTTAWAEFADNPQVEKRLLAINQAGTQVDRVLQSNEGLQYKGTVEGFNIWVYAGWYVDPTTGTETEIWPAKACALVSPLIEGEQLHGAIEDPAVGFRAVEVAPKMWQDNDPPLTWLMLQSAPLVAPRRPDASVYCADVVG